ncbi:hypothetical protein KODAMA_00770 [Serratia phage vB_SmaM-Kodama]|nr:hypothetical protein KODAMA_00770 [Serratia phage vB_SmaM-Kodama]
MLKSPEAYASKAAYESQLFLHKANVDDFALWPNAGLVLRIMSHNEETTHTDAKPRIIIQRLNNTIPIFQKEAELLLSFAKMLINGPSLPEIRVGRFSYIKSENREAIFIESTSSFSRIMFLAHLNSSPIENGFKLLLGRLIEILEQFLRICNNEPVTIDKHFTFGDSTLVGLGRNSEGNHVIPHLCLANRCGIKSIIFSIPDKSSVNISEVLFDGEDILPLDMVVNVYINAIKEIATRHKLRSSIPTPFRESVQLFDGKRSTHMEFVSILSFGHSEDDHLNGLTPASVISINSETFVHQSKAVFKYDEVFVNSLLKELSYLGELSKTM